MAELSRCLVFEWGFGFIVFVFVVGVALMAFLIFLAKYFRLNERVKVPNEAGYGEAKIRGNVVGFAAVIVAFALIVGGVYWTYNHFFYATYSVSFDTATAPSATLETIRSKFQRDTSATIIVKDAVKNFAVSGQYGGACTPSLFESICRRFSGRLTCDSSAWNRTVVVDSK